MRATQQHDKQQQHDPIRELRAPLRVDVKLGDCRCRTGLPPIQAVRVTVTHQGFAINPNGSRSAIPDAFCLLSPSEARRHAARLLQAAENAEQAGL